MSVRAAKYQDIYRIVELMADAHARSRDADITTFDAIEAKQLLMRCIQRHRHMNYMGTLVMVSERKGVVEGFVIGILDLVYPCLKELKVTDLLFIFSKRASSRDAERIVVKLIEWGRSNPKVIKILLGVTDDLIDWKRVGNLYQMAGLEQCGGLYRMDITHAEQQTARAS